MIDVFFFISLSLFLLVNQDKAKVFTYISLHTLFFYFFILMHILSIIYLKYISTQIVSQFPGIHIESINRTMIALSIFMIFYCLSLYFTNDILFPSNNLKKQILLTYDTYKSFSINNLIVLVFLFIVVAAVIYYLISIDRVPFFVMFDNIGNKTPIYDARRSLKFDLHGYIYVMMIIRVLGIYILTYYLVRLVILKKSLLLFVVTLCLVLFSNLLSFHRSPLLWIIIYVFFVHYAIRNDFKLKIRKEFFILFLFIIAFFVIIQWLITNNDLFMILNVFLIRSVFGQALTLISYFTVYPELHHFVGFGFSGPLSSISGTVLHVPAEEIYSHLVNKNFTRPVIYNTIGVGDFYAGFGYYGVSICGFITGSVIHFTNLYLLNTKKTIFTITSIFTLMFVFSKLNAINILVCLNSWCVFYIFIFTIIVNKIVYR